MAILPIRYLEAEPSIEQHSTEFAVKKVIGCGIQRSSGNVRGEFLFKGPNLSAVDPRILPYICDLTYLLLDP